MKCLLFVLCTSVALAQTPGSTALIASSLIDSTLGVSLTTQLYDFYYSAKQAESFIQLGTASYTREDQIKKKRFRGRIVTELVLTGHKPDEHFDDYTLIGSGKLEDVNSDGAW